MKFLKTSIIVLFILSFSSATLSLYLSNVRENEKEKRLYLEGVKVDLEDRLAKLELEKVQLTEQVSKLEEKLKAEQTARQEALSLISQKDVDLKTLRGQAKEAQVAFTDAQKRNQELEQILDELEARMRQIEGQNQLPGSEVGYLEINPVAPKEGEAKASSAQVAKEEKKDQTPEISFKPLTALPEPPKKRRHFPFFRFSKNKKSEPVKEVVPTLIAEQPIELPVEVIQKNESKPVSEEVKPEPVQVKTQEATKPVQKTDQAIAAGSVLLVNRKYNFVVVNLGLHQSLDVNDLVSIQQEGKQIAKARVEKVYDDYSAAYIVEEQSDHPIAEGNSVSRA